MTAPVTCTIIAANYVAEARVLARSFTEHHPGARLQVLVIDDRDGRIRSGNEPFDVLGPVDLPMSAREFHDMAACYEVMELATAVKPSLLLRLLERSGGRPTVYLDPDILVLAPLDELTELATTHPIVLTPHTSRPMARDGRKPTEFDILASGTWNLGFAAVNGGADGFLRWWAERLRFDALVDHANMRFTDQRWIDLAPAYFDVHPLRDPCYNVAYWNADQRPVTWSGGRYLVEGRPLRFFHFSGFDRHRPHVLSKHQGDRPRVLLSEQPALARLCREYADRLATEGIEEGRRIPYGWEQLADGTTLTPRMRRLYRQALIDVEAGLVGEPPPDPFDPHSENGLVRWLASPAPENPAAPAVPRFFWEIYRGRTDLQRAFPLAGSTQGGRFRTWLWNAGRHEEEIPRPVLATAFGVPTWKRTDEPRWAGREALRPGYLVTGYLRAELGIGEAARLAVDTMRRAGIPHGTHSFDLTASRQDHPVGTLSTPVDLNTNVVWINPDQLPSFVDSVGPAFFDGRYTVGAWAWETERLPTGMAMMSAYVDEVWAPSEYSRRSIEAAIDKPVFAVPHPIVVPAVDRAVDRSAHGLPEGFFFLFVFDFFSTLARKNPLGLIEAFSRAFRPGEGPSLVLKSVNGSRMALEMERVRMAVGDRPDIVLLDTYLHPRQCATLVALADCYVSLHRAEGFGLTMAEAAALGTPVVATGYSGNLEFLDDRTAYLVPWALGPVGRDADPYVAGDSWAEPDLDAAADLLRRVYEHPEEARRKAAEARRTVLTEHGHATAVRRISARFREIQEKLLDGYVSPVADLVAGRSSGGS